jgi:hypothetical protein
MTQFLSSSRSAVNRLAVGHRSSDPSVCFVSVLRRSGELPDTPLSIDFDWLS